MRANEYFFTEFFSNDALFSKFFRSLSNLATKNLAKFAQNPNFDFLTSCTKMYRYYNFVFIKNSNNI